MKTLALVNLEVHVSDYIKDDLDSKKHADVFNLA